MDSTSLKLFTSRQLLYWGAEADSIAASRAAMVSARIEPSMSFSAAVMRLSAQIQGEVGVSLAGLSCSALVLFAIYLIYYYARTIAQQRLMCVKRGEFSRWYDPLVFNPFNRTVIPIAVIISAAYRLFHCSLEGGSVSTVLLCQAALFVAFALLDGSSTFVRMLDCYYALYLAVCAIVVVCSNSISGARSVAARGPLSHRLVTIMYIPIAAYLTGGLVVTSLATCASTRPLHALLAAVSLSNSWPIVRDGFYNYDYFNGLSYWPQSKLFDYEQHKYKGSHGDVPAGYCPAPLLTSYRAVTAITAINAAATTTLRLLASGFIMLWVSLVLSVAIVQYDNLHLYRCFRMV